jgi:hypothetical protein
VPADVFREVFAISNRFAPVSPDSRFAPAAGPRALRHHCRTADTHATLVSVAVSEGGTGTTAILLLPDLQPCHDTHTHAHAHTHAHTRTHTRADADRGL